MSKKSEKELLSTDSPSKIDFPSDAKKVQRIVETIIQDLLANGLIKNNQFLLSTKKFEEFHRKTYNTYYDNPESYLILIDQIQRQLVKTNSPKKRRIRDLSKDEMQKIVKDYQSGHSLNSLALEYGLGRNAVSIILREHKMEIVSFQVNTRINITEAKKLRLIEDYTRVLGSIDFMGHSIDKAQSRFTLTSISRFLLGAAIDIKYNESLNSIIIDYIACVLVAKRNLDSDIKIKYKKLVDSNIFSATDELLDIKKEYTDWLRTNKESIFDRVLNEFKSYGQDKFTVETFDILYEKGCEFSNNLSSNSPEFVSRISFFKSLGTIIDVPYSSLDD